MKSIFINGELGIRSIIRAERPYFSTSQVMKSDGRVAANLGDQRLYLSAIKDLHGNDIVAFHISHSNDNEFALKTFDKAFEQHKDVTGLIVHSDQGFQYTSHL